MAKSPKKRGRPSKADKAAKETPAARRAPVNSGSAKINPEALERLVKSVLGRAAEQKSIGMTAKEMIDKAAETQGLDKPAFGMVRKLYKMGKDNPEKLAITLPHLLSYIDDLQLADIADGARGLPINGEDDDSEHQQIDIEQAIDAAPESPARLTIVPGPKAPGEEAA